MGRDSQRSGWAWHAIVASLVCVFAWAAPAAAQLPDLGAPLPAPELPAAPEVPDLPGIPQVLPGGELPDVPGVTDLPVVGDVGEAIEDLLQGGDGIPGDAGSAVFTWHSRYVDPSGGTVEIDNRGVPAAPTPIDVTGDRVPDLLAQLELEGSNRVGVRLTRLLTAPPRLPLAIEAVFETGGQRVRFGYDAREDTAPGVYQSSVGVTGGGSVSFDTAVSDPGTALTQTAGAADLDAAGDEQNRKSGSIRFAPVPLASHIGLLTSADNGGRSTEFELSTSEVSHATVDADVEDGADRTIARAVIDRVPQQVSLGVAESGGTRTMSYAAGGRVDQIDISYGQRRDGAATQRLEALLGDVPTAVTVQQNGAHTALDAPGRIGVLEVAGSDGGPLHRLDDDQYAYLRRAGGEETFALRVLGLHEAEVSTGEELTLRTASDGGRFRFLQEDGDQRIEALVEDLPSEALLSYTPADQMIDLQTSAAIGRFSVTATNPAGLAGSRATSLEATLTDVPTHVTARPGAGRTLELDGHGQAIGSLDFLMTSGPEVSFPDGEDGVTFEDLPDRYVAAARLTGLRRVSVTGGDTPEVVLDSIAHRPFKAHVLRAAAAGDPVERIDAAIDFLQPQTTLSVVDGAAGPRVRIGSQPATTALDVEAENLSGLTGLDPRAKLLRAKLRDLPETLDIGLTDEGDAVGIDAGGGTLGLLDVLLTSGPEGTLPENADAVLMEDLPEHFLMRARLSGLREITVGTGSTPSLTLGLAGGNPFSAQVRRQQPGGELETLDAAIDELKPNTAISYEQTPSGPLVHFGADEVTGELTVSSHGLIDVGQRADNLSLTLRQIPTSLDLGLAQGSDGVELVAGDGLGELIADVHDDAGPVQLAGGADGLRLVDTADRYAAHAHFVGLKRAAVTTGAAPVIELDTVDRRPFAAELEQQAAASDPVTHIRAAIDALQPNTRIAYEATGASPRISFGADAPTGAFDLDATDLSGLGGRARNAHLKLREIPERLTLDLDQAAGSVDIDAGGARLGLLEAILDSDGQNRTLPETTDGLMLEDTASHYAVFARLTGLRRARVTLEPEPGLLLDLDNGGRPFEARMKRPNDDGSEANLVATVPRLERNTELRYAFDEAAGPRFTFSAAARTQAIDVDATNVGGLSDRARNLDLHLGDIPTSLSISLAKDQGSFDIDAGGDELGVLDVLLTSGPDIRFADPEVDGFKLYDTGSEYALYGRLRRLRHVAVGVEPNPSLEIDLGAPRRFLVEVDQPAAIAGDPAQRIRATIDQVQPNTSLSYSTEGGTPVVLYSAGGTTNSIDLEANNLSGLGTRVKKIDVHMEGLPSSLALGLSAESGAINIDANGERLGLLEALASDGVTVPSLAGASDDGVAMVDTPLQYAVFGRITGLRRVTAALAPTPSLDLHADGNRVFTVSLRNGSIGAEQVIEARLDELQPDTQIELVSDATGQSLSYTASPGVMDSLTISGDNLTALGAKAKKLRVAMQSVPTSLTLGLSSSSGQVDIDAGSRTLGFLQAEVSDGKASSAPSIAPGRSGLELVDTATNYLLFGRVSQLRRVRVIAAPAPDLILNTGAAQPFDAKLTQPGQTINASLNDLQPSTTIKFTTSPSTTFNYSASAPTSSLVINATGLSVGRANSVNMTLTGMPSALNLNLGSGGSRVILDAGGQTIGSMEALLSSGGSVPAIATGEDGLVYIDTPAQYALRTRITGLRKIDATTSPNQSLFLDSTGNKVFNVSLNTGSLVTARLTTLKPATTITLTKSGTRQNITYSSSQQASRLEFNANGVDAQIGGTFGGVTYAVPTSMTICQDSGRLCGGSGQTNANAGSASLTANATTLLNLANSAFTVTNLRVKRLTYDAHLESTTVCLFVTSTRGHVYMDTDTERLDGSVRIDQSGLVDYVQMDFGNFAAQNRFVRLKGGNCVPTPQRDGSPTGTVRCGSGTNLFARVTFIFNFDVGMTGLICDAPGNTL